MVKQSGDRKNKLTPLLPLLCLLNLGLLTAELRPPKALGAERIYIEVGLLRRSLPIDSLDTFAKTGKIDRELGFYAQFAGPVAMAELRVALQRRFKINKVVVSRLTYSPLAEDALKRIGLVLRTDARLNGFHAIRAAWLKAADQPDGFTVIDLVRAFPARGIQLNVGQLLSLQQILSSINEYTDTTVEAIAQEAQREAVTVSVDFSRLPNPLEPGSFKFSQTTLRLQRPTQAIEGTPTTRSFYVNLYLPESKRPAPVVVVSHGLGSTPTAFAYLGTHLASHGFIVAIPEHVGSGEEQFQALFTGLSNSNVRLTEFIERPLDIKQVLDELEKLAQTDLSGKIDLTRVGIMGHSFGGYTALTSAGGTLNLERIFRTCNLANRLNLSVGLQCLNEALPRFDPSVLHDPRIKAAIAINPLTSIVLGPEGMGTVKVPTMLVGGSRDILTPLVAEQVHPYFWLNTPEKYLVAITAAGHTAADGTGEDANPTLGSFGEFLSGPDPVLTRQYVRALALIFMQTYVGDRPEYRTYLNSAYTQFITRAPLPINLVRSLTPQQLEQAYGGSPPIPFVPELLPGFVATQSTVKK